jgi:hypothetical protein
MAVIVVCIVLVLAGLAAVVRWGGLTVEPAPVAADSAEPPSMGLVLRRYLWYLTLVITSGLLAGILAAGAGGRLVMRLLAITAGTCGCQEFGSHHATCAYSWISPLSRSRRTTLPAGWMTGGSAGPSGGACPKARCGRWPL